MSSGSGNIKFSFPEAERAHAKWKTRLVEYINGRSQENLEVAKVSCDDQCDLGKWIYGDARKYAHLHEYEHLRQSHAAFHQSVGAIVEFTQAGQIDQAKKLLGGDFYQTSNKTVNAIRAMQESVEGDVVSYKTGTDSR